MRFMVFRTSKGRYSNSETPPCEGAVRDTAEGRPIWYVEIPDLAALIAFAANGEVVISTSKNRANRNSPCLEIYDDYRE